MEVRKGEVVLCRFYFSDLKAAKNRPVLVLKDNLPFNDFVGIPISSKVSKRQQDEVLIHNHDFELGGLPALSKLMVRKTFVVSKTVIQKKYGIVSTVCFKKFHQYFCDYFECGK